MKWLISLCFVLVVSASNSPIPQTPARGVVTGGGAPVEALWSTPILQQQTDTSHFVTIGTAFSTDADQFIHNTDSVAAPITKVTTQFQETEGSDQTVVCELRTASHGGGSLYESKTLTLHASMTENLAFVFSTTTIPANTNFYIHYTVTTRARILGNDVGGGGAYEGTTYSIFFNGSADDTFDVAFAIYITR